MWCANYFSRFGNYWFLRLLHTHANGGRKLAPKEAGEAMASSAGPGAAQIGEGRQTYHNSLRKRISHNGMLEKIRIYREGLFRDPWEKSIETIVALSELQSSSSRSGAGLFEDGPRGALKAPATIIYGLDDPAFESRLALDGISDYLSKGSAVVPLEDGGHWLPLEKDGSGLITEVVLRALNGRLSTTEEWKEWLTELRS